MLHIRKDYIFHYGVKGMKWGVRRTAAQLGHKIKNAAKSAHEKYSESRPSRVRKMSADELQKAIKRLELEREYAKLLDARGRKWKNKGESIAKEILNKSGKNIGSQLATYLMGSAVNVLAGDDIVNPKKGQKDK